MKLKKKITKISEPKDDSSIIIERENQKVKKYIASHLWTGKQQKLYKNTPHIKISSQQKSSTEFLFETKTDEEH